MKQKIMVMFLVAAMLIAAGVVLARPSDNMGTWKTTTDALRWDTPHGKEGGEEGILNGFNPVDDSDY